MKKLFLLMIISSSLVWAQNKPDFSPKFSGYVRSWYQTDFATDKGEFLIKEARLGIKGNVNEYAAYKFLVDFTRLGKLQSESDTINGKKVITSAAASFSDILLEAEASITPIENLSFSIGQSKVPFSTDNIKSGAEMEFANRPLITNVAPGLYDIGLIGSYTNKNVIPAEIKAGLFNGTGPNKSENDKTLNYLLRVNMKPLDGFGISANYYGGSAAGADINVFDFGTELEISKVLFAAEYCQKLSELKSKDVTSNAFFVYSVYDLELGNFLVSHIMPAVRYEYFEPDNSTTDDGISRVTAGLSLQFAKINYARLRINYEMFDYRDGRNNPDKFIIELQTRF